MINCVRIVRATNIVCTRIHHQTAQHLQIANQQFRLCAQPMPYAVQLCLQNFVKFLRHTILHRYLVHVHKSIDTLHFFHQIIHHIEYMRLDHRHFLAHRYVQLDHLRFVRFQRFLYDRMESRPYEQIFDEKAAHHFFDVAIAVRKRFGTVAERFDETGFVRLTVQSQRKCLLARFDNLMGSHHNDARYQFDGNAFFQQIDDENACGHELNAAHKVDLFSVCGRGGK